MRSLTGGLLLAVALALTACGRAADTPGIATANGGSAAPTATAPGAGNLHDQMLAYAQCMRENGVPEFPDPQFTDDGRGVNLGIPPGTDRAKVDAAHQRCKDKMPNGGEPGRADPQVLEQMRKYAQCMRDNGFPDFPDPSDEGLRINGDEHPDLNPNNPKYVAADEACRQHLPPPPSGEAPRNETGGSA